MELLLLAPILILGYLLWRSQRASERMVSDFLATVTTMSERGIDERSSLLNRIQAPEVEVAKAAPEPTEPAYLPFEDDDAFHAYKEEQRLRAEMSNGGAG